MEDDLAELKNQTFDEEDVKQVEVHTTIDEETKALEKTV